MHLQSPTLNGRKFWAWGNDPYDLYRMEFLSSDSVPGSGRYFEMQSGVAPTQFQTFAFPANTTLEWTEAFVPIDASADPAAKAKLQAADYSAATAYMEQLSQAVVSEAVFADIDAFLSQHKDVPVSEILANGTDFGALYYKRTGVARPAGLSFPDQVVFLLHTSSPSSYSPLILSSLSRHHLRRPRPGASCWTRVPL